MAPPAASQSHLAVACVRALARSCVSPRGCAPPARQCSRRGIQLWRIHDECREHDCSAPAATRDSASIDGIGFEGVAVDQCHCG
jgi:hypothetical protein